MTNLRERSAKVAGIIEEHQAIGIMLREPSEILGELLKSLAKCKKEVLVAIPSVKAVETMTRFIERSAERAGMEGLKTRILMPISADVQPIMVRFPQIQWHSWESIGTGLVIFDQEKMLVTSYNEADTTSGGMQSATIVTNRQTISGVVSIFRALLQESEIRRREEKRRKQAELLQDILTHDIRNYNQVTRLAAEFLREEFQENSNVLSLTSSLIDSIDGSTQLLEKAKKLGRILSEEHPVLHSVEVEESIDHALSLIRSTFPQKEIAITKGFAKAVKVQADELLEEVFANVFSNAAKYTPGNRVAIEINVEEEMGMPNALSKVPVVKVSIMDHGRGIPDEIKESVFSRYFHKSSGSGLGMSIVHALVVERYRGHVRIEDRVKGDYSKGAAVRIWLPRALE